MIAARPLVATVIASLGTLVAAFLPWLRTGEATRSAFALARSAGALGFVDTPLRRAVVVTWYLLPLLVAAVWTAAAFGLPRIAAGAAAAVGVMSVAAGTIVTSWARAAPGPVAGVIAGAAALLSSGWLSVSIWSSRREPMERKGSAG